MLYNLNGDEMKKILLVEDSETIIMGLKYSLEQENFNVKV